MSQTVKQRDFSFYNLQEISISLDSKNIRTNGVGKNLIFGIITQYHALKLNHIEIYVPKYQTRVFKFESLF